MTSFDEFTLKTVHKFILQVMYRVALSLRIGGSEIPDRWLSFTGPMAQNDPDYS